MVPVDHGISEMAMMAMVALPRSRRRRRRRRRRLQSGSWSLLGVKSLVADRLNSSHINSTAIPLLATLSNLAMVPMVAVVAVVAMVAMRVA